LPHVPQLVASLFESMHAPLHASDPAGQLQLELTHA
jgi:hypothetical protein